MSEERGLGGFMCRRNPLFLCRLNEILRFIQTSIPQIDRAVPINAGARCGMKENVRIKRGE